MASTLACGFCGAELTSAEPYSRYDPLHAKHGPAAETYVPPATEARIRSLQQQIGKAHAAGKYDEARLAAAECRELARSLFGPDHPVSASAVNNLALVHRSLGERERATALYREALVLYRRSVGAEHQSTAT
ncbi:hypothetical protein EMIHUDRAFT_258178, partial [Emiliania huxleyi CCMP1516]|uniref:Tetratricopeptide repeat protein n=2 Tax=Emiliania huxleyi TaxID=2903 RepID=A0A0D3IBR8_EMIH1